MSTEDIGVETKDPEAHRLVHAVGDIAHGPTEIGVDNKGAFDVYHRTTALAMAVARAVEELAVARAAAREEVVMAVEV